jgi:hypothetical protein
MSFEDTNQAARDAADSMFGELRFTDVAIGMLSSLLTISEELGDSELEVEARAALAFAALAKRWQELRAMSEQSTRG